MNQKDRKALKQRYYTKNRHRYIKKANILASKNAEPLPKGFNQMLDFPLIEAILGRRARRFSVGSVIPDGPFAFKSNQKAEPLSQLEQLLILSAVSGNTGWHNMIYRAKKYAPHLSNYSMAGGGRTFPSAAGFHTTEFFYTDDAGVYFIPTRDLPSVVPENSTGKPDIEDWLVAHQRNIVKLSGKRLKLPPQEPYMEAHNTWCVNRPGSTLIIPVADIAMHMIANLCFLVQNGQCIYDDQKDKKIPGLEEFKDLVDTSDPFPLTFIEQYCLTEATAELSTSCYAGMLMLQAIGLGGWMFDGIDRFSLLGASGEDDVPGLGFQYRKLKNNPLPEITGLPGIFEGHCPPHFSTMRDAVKSVCERKFGKNGPFNVATPGPWKESGKIRGSAQVHNDRFIDCVSTMAQYIFDTYDKFPGTVPAIFTLTYLQAHHLDLEFYDKYYKEGAYLDTHKNHWKNWHGDKL